MIVVPCGDGSLSVADLTTAALIRYRKATAKVRNFNVCLPPNFLPSGYFDIPHLTLVYKSLSDQQLNAFLFVGISYWWPNINTRGCGNNCCWEVHVEDSWERVFPFPMAKNEWQNCFSRCFYSQQRPNRSQSRLFRFNTDCSWLAGSLMSDTRVRLFGVAPVKSTELEISPNVF